MKSIVSIALATYNGEKYLEAQLESFLSQTRLPDELIICDDGSTDKTVAIAQRFAGNSPFTVKLFVNEINIGYAQNFSKALSSCTGEYILLSDQDDVWSSNKIEKMISFFQSNLSLQLLIHDLEFCKSDLTPIGQTKIQRMTDVFDVQRDYVVGMATAVRRKFLQHCLPIPDAPGMTHDSWLHSCAWACDNKLIMDDVLALYRRHENNATNESKLNVDFVTNKDHFQSDSSNTLNLLKQKTTLDKPVLHPLTQWLIDKRNILIQENLATSDRLDSLIESDLDRFHSMTARYDLLQFHKLFRLKKITALYLQGGYKYFSGWKSVLKDLILN